jgi:hypothetical protein
MSPTTPSRARIDADDERSTHGQWRDHGHTGTTTAPERSARTVGHGQDDHGQRTTTGSGTTTGHGTTTGAPARPRVINRGQRHDHGSGTTGDDVRYDDGTTRPRPIDDERIDG